MKILNAIHENSTGSVFKIQTINSIQIKNLILGIKTRKYCGYDIILPRLVKESADVIVQPLASIINCTIRQSRYLVNCKSGGRQVTPEFKKDDSKANYRPIIVLPVFNNTDL